MSTTFTDPSFEDVKGYNTEQLSTFLERKNLNLNKNVFTIFHQQNINGFAFVNMTYKQLISFLTSGSATKLERVIKELNKQSRFYNFVCYLNRSLFS